MHRKRKQKRKDSTVWKRFLETILSQIPPYIEKYPPEDRVHLKEFYSILQGYNVDTITARNALSARIEEFIQKHQNSEEYFQLPFLWYARRYFANAHLLLSMEGFFADRFYGYLVQYLRGNSKTDGAFRLIRNTFPLTDLAWEKLQYASIELQVPLTAKHLQILETIYSSIGELGVHALNPQRIKNIIKNRMKSPKISRELPKFFKRLDAQWLIQFYPPAFGLEYQYFQFKLSKSATLREIIDLQDPANTVLNLSYIFRVRNYPDAYIGLLVIPAKMTDRLQSYLKRFENQGKLISHELSMIDTIRRSTSLALYQAEEGWSILNRSEQRRLTHQLRIKRPRKKRVEVLPFYLTPSFNHNWYFQQHPQSSKMIDLYCKIAAKFSFTDLPLSLTNEQTRFRFSKSEMNLFKELLNEQVVHIGFLCKHLWSEFSLDDYWIKLPKLPQQQTRQLLQWLPFSELFFTERTIHMRARLTPDLVRWIKNDLEWTVIPIIPNHYPSNIKREWFNPKILKWKSPFILRTING